MSSEMKLKPIYCETHKFLEYPNPAEHIKQLKNLHLSCFFIHLLHWYWQKEPWHRDFLLTYFSLVILGYTKEAHDRQIDCYWLWKLGFHTHSAYAVHICSILTLYELTACECVHVLTPWWRLTCHEIGAVIFSLNI